MKKNLSGKHKDHKGKKLSRTNRSKLRRSKKVEEVFRRPGPSPYIKLHVVDALAVRGEERRGTLR